MRSVFVLYSDGYASPLQEALQEHVVLPGEDLGEERPAVSRLIAKDVDLLHDVVGVDELQASVFRREEGARGGNLSYKGGGLGKVRLFKIDHRARRNDSGPGGDKNMHEICTGNERPNLERLLHGF